MKRRKGKSNNSVGTPEIVYNFIETKFNIKKDEFYDPCPLNPNYTVDSLKISWENHPNIYCNPPYSSVKMWVRKCLQEFKNPKIKQIFLLIKCDNLANGYMKTVCNFANLFTFSKRLTFVGYNHSAGFGSILLHFNRKSQGQWITV